MSGPLPPVFRHRIMATFACCLAALTGAAASRGQAAAVPEPKEPPAVRPTDLPPATLVTLHLKNEPVRQAFERFAAQAHLALAEDVGKLWERHADQTVTLDFDRLPYWEALARLCQKSGLAPWRGVDDRRCLYVGDDNFGWSRRPAQIIGPFYLDAASAEGGATTTLGRQPVSKRSCVLTFDLGADPAIDVLRSDGVKISEIIDDAGKPISYRFPMTSTELNFENHVWGMKLDLAPNPRSRKVARILGTIDVVLREKTEPITLLDVQRAQNVERKIGPLRFFITTNYEVEGWSVDVELRDERNDPFLFEQAVRDMDATTPLLLDAQGRAWEKHGWGTGGRDFAHPTYKDFVGYRYHQDRNVPPDMIPGPPATLLWNIVVGTKRVRVPFEFKDLELP